jgi:1,4-dihydroxy-2-naphthoyl-CoA hydrolase
VSGDGSDRAGSDRAGSDVAGADVAGPDGAGADMAGADGDPSLGPASGFSLSIGMYYEEVTGTRVVGRIDIGPRHLQPNGIVHGGLFTGAVEEAASYGATVAVRDRGQSVVGVANTTNFIRPVSGGRVRVEAVPLQQGRTQQLWEVRITRVDDDVLVAVGQLRLQNLAPRS